MPNSGLDSANGHQCIVRFQICIVLKVHFCSQYLGLNKRGDNNRFVLNEIVCLHYLNSLR